METESAPICYSEAQRGMTMSKSYIRSSDGATMIELQPHQYVNAKSFVSKAALLRTSNTAKQPRHRLGGRQPPKSHLQLRMQERAV